MGATYREWGPEGAHGAGPQAGPWGPWDPCRVPGGPHVGSQVEPGFQVDPMQGPSRATCRVPVGTHVGSQVEPMNCPEKTTWRMVPY